MVVIWVILLAFVAWLIWMQVGRGYFILQYLFFLRYPLLLGLVLLLLPLGAMQVTDEVVKNLFVLNFTGLVVTAWLGIFAAWAIMYSLGVLYIHTPERLGLTLQGWERDENRSVKRDANDKPIPIPNSIPKMLKSLPARLTLFGFLAMPIIVATVWLSPGPIWLRLIAVVCGVVIAIALRMGAVPLNKWFTGTRIDRAVNSGWQRAKGLTDQVGKTLLGEEDWKEGQGGYENERDNVFLHRNARLFAVITFAIYFAGYFALRPDTGIGAAREAVPAIAYLLLLLILLGWVLSWLSFKLDKYRILPELVIIAFMALTYGFFGTDHFYEVRNVACKQAPEFQSLLDPIKYVEGWAGPQQSGKPPPPMIVVMASGGGIKAAYWTATVLTRLHAEPDLGSEFTRGISLLSGASGGAVGGMYYINAVLPDGELDNPEGVMAAAGRSSLAAMGWGLIYPDFLRIALPIFNLKLPDRGWAMEKRWAESFGANGVPMLSQWKKDVAAGKRPAIIFNATITETGERLLISPLDVHRPGETAPTQDWRARSFNELYPGGDLSVVTAARLSATFPYITPISRPLLPADCDRDAYHVADGGYFDNFGVVSGIEFLQQVLPTYRKLGGDRVLLVQIRAFDYDQENRSPPRDDVGLRYTFLGPVDTMLAVRSSSQIARNDLEIALLKAKWARECILIEDVVFELKQKGPLSWHLSADEQNAIRDYWPVPQIQNQVSEVKSFLRASRAPQCAR